MKNKPILPGIHRRHFLSDAQYEDTLPHTAKSAGNLFDAWVFGRPGLQEDSGPARPMLIALPKTRLTRALQPGDILVVRSYGAGKAYEAVLATGRMMTRAQALEAGFYARAGAPGLFVELNGVFPPAGQAGRRVARRIADENGFLLYDCLLLRPTSSRSFEYDGNPYIAPTPATPAQPVTAPPPTPTPALRPAEAVEPNAVPCLAGSRKITTATGFGAVISCQKPDGTPHGAHIEIWKNNKQKAEGQYEHGRLTGQWRSWYENGQLQVETTYSDGLQEGPYKKWFENGQLGQEGNYRKGKKERLWVFYDAEGQKREEGSFAGGLKTGAWHSWHGNGKLASKGSYENGSPTGIWTTWHYNGQKAGEGRVEGMMTRTVGRRTWNTPKRVDQWAFWYANGQQFKKGNYINGYQEGDWNHWDRGGVLARTTTYTRGVPADKEKPRIA